jgi:hypothetical protein
MTLARQLRQAQTSDDAEVAIREADRALDQWVSDRRAHAEQRGSLLLSFGAEITFPRDVWRQP